jgi:hypothetical protein
LAQWQDNPVKSPLMIASMVVILAGTGVLLAYGSTGVNIATVIAATLAAVGIVVSIWLDRRKTTGERPDVPSSVVVELARKVLQRERVALARALGQPGEVVPAKVGFHQPPLVYWHTDGGSRRSSSDEIADYYDRLDRGRLVIVGEAGAGKSILATCLCVGLAGKAIERPDEVPVPVRLSLLTFDPERIPHDQPGEIGARRLVSWIVRNLVEIYDIDPDLAARLVAERRVLPVLDGLDEMDANPYRLDRAAELARALNHFTSGELPPFVLTSRRDCFNRITKQSTTHVTVPIQHTTVVDLDPLKMTDVIAYLKHRFPDPAAPHRIHPRWRPVVAELRSAGETPLKQALSLPLYLFLLTAAYQAESSQPVEILDLETTEAVRDRLYELLITAGVVRNSEILGTYRDLSAELATMWLENLAEATATRTYITESRVDIELARVHRIAGAPPRYLAALLMAAMVTPLFILVWQKVGIAALFSIPVPIFAVTAQAMPTSLKVWSFSHTQFTKACRKPSNIAFIMLLLIPLGVGVVGQGKVAAVSMGLYVFGGFFLALGPVKLFRGLRNRDFSDEGGLSSLFQRVGAASATRLVRSGVTATMINLALQLLLFVPLARFPQVATPLVVGVAGLAVMNIALSPWLTYAMASLTFRFSRRFASRPARFLDWAQEAGLIGVYGDVLRFRHREFQAWLIKRRVPIELSTSVLAERLD